ncbi:MAG: hypothetical protein ABS43_03715 [Bordetella sp. SCN 67-23]|nr:DUF3486 family protein [Burkholderiales bacterium]ODS75909.1 MAG: hypothetical protein ABS43_03715 [Bordetella sp. SCN 67-23]OJW91785.1 MAG: hypothetical protein BGO71_21745 [Burkholderiales bacterium 67-32]
MARRSSIERLDPAIRDACNELIRSGHTIDEIVQTLRDLGANVSRSAVGRFTKSARASMEKFREAQEVAKVWIDKLESEPNGDVARLLPEMLRAVAFQTLSTMGESESPVESQELMFLAKALKDVSGASKLNMDIELKLRQEREKAKVESADAVEKAARAQGMDEDQVMFWRQQVLGLK